LSIENKSIERDIDHTLHTQVVARVPSYVDLKKKCVRYPSVMNFEGQSGSGSQEICDLFAGFIVRTYADEPWVPSDPGPGDVSDEPPFGSIQFSLLEVLNALLDLDTNKGPGPDNVPPLILKSCASAFALPLCLLFNRSLASCVFPDRWKLSFVSNISLLSVGATTKHLTVSSIFDPTTYIFGCSPGSSHSRLFPAPHINSRFLVYQ
jgi:hypothetical protein